MNIKNENNSTAKMKLRNLGTTEELTKANLTKFIAMKKMFLMSRPVQIMLDIKN